MPLRENFIERILPVALLRQGLLPLAPDAFRKNVYRNLEIPLGIADIGAAQYWHPFQGDHTGSPRSSTLSAPTTRIQASPRLPLQ